MILMVVGIAFFLFVPRVILSVTIASIHTATTVIKIHSTLKTPCALSIKKLKRFIFGQYVQSTNIS